MQLLKGCGRESSWDRRCQSHHLFFPSFLPERALSLLVRFRITSLFWLKGWGFLIWQPVLSAMYTLLSEAVVKFFNLSFSPLPGAQLVSLAWTLATQISLHFSLLLFVSYLSITQDHNPNMICCLTPILCVLQVFKIWCPLFWGVQCLDLTADVRVKGEMVIPDWWEIWAIDNLKSGILKLQCLNLKEFSTNV